MEFAGLIVAIVALIISVASAVIARIALKEQIRVSQLTANYSAVASADASLFNNKDLLELHNINEELLEESGVTHVELLYLADSFQAAELYYRIENNKSVVLNQYRQNQLRNEKVQKAWKGIIRGRFSSYAPFTEAIDKFIEANPYNSERQLDSTNSQS